MTDIPEHRVVRVLSERRRKEEAERPPCCRDLPLPPDIYVEVLTKQFDVIVSFIEMNQRFPRFYQEGVERDYFMEIQMMFFEFESPEKMSRCEHMVKLNVAFNAFVEKMTEFTRRFEVSQPNFEEWLRNPVKCKAESSDAMAVSKIRASIIDLMKARGQYKK